MRLSDLSQPWRPGVAALQLSSYHASCNHCVNIIFDPSSYVKKATYQHLSGLSCTRAAVGAFPEACPDRLPDRL